MEEADESADNEFGSYPSQMRESAARYEAMDVPGATEAAAYCRRLAEQFEETHAAYLTTLQKGGSVEHD